MGSAIRGPGPWRRTTGDFRVLSKTALWLFVCLFDLFCFRERRSSFPESEELNPFTDTDLLKNQKTALTLLPTPDAEAHPRCSPQFGGGRGRVSGFPSSGTSGSHIRNANRHEEPARKKPVAESEGDPSVELSAPTPRWVIKATPSGARTRGCVSPGCWDARSVQPFRPRAAVASPTPKQTHSAPLRSHTRILRRCPNTFYSA